MRVYIDGAVKHGAQLGRMREICDDCRSGIISWCLDGKGKGRNSECQLSTTKKHVMFGPKSHEAGYKSGLLGISYDLIWHAIMTIPVVETQQQVVKIDPVGERILQELSNTPFNCVHLVRLTGGILNFVYRGTLSHPLSDGAITVIIKHAEEFMPGLEGYTLSTHRSV
jgi:hypothetical protein